MSRVVGCKDGCTTSDSPITTSFCMDHCASASFGLWSWSMKFPAILCYRWGGSMKFMFWYRMGVLIFCATSSEIFAIWLWIYICHVSDAQRTNVLIVESLYLMIFSAIDPPARSECAPIMMGSITFSCILRVFAAILTTLTTSLLVNYIHALLCQTPQSRFSYVPLFIRMWYTLHTRTTTAPLLTVDLWCKVFLILLFFWFKYFSVGESC